jgi:hypothetical protein
MTRGFFGRRKGQQLQEPAGGWPQLPGALEAPRAQALDPPAVAYAMSVVTDGAARTPEAELLERVAAFRGAVADALFAISKDYQVLCNLTRENLEACEDTVEELRRRLAGNIHFQVLAKLDAVHALVETHVAGSARESDPSP